VQVRVSRVFLFRDLLKSTGPAIDLLHTLGSNAGYLSQVCHCASGRAKPDPGCVLSIVDLLLEPAHQLIESGLGIRSVVDVLEGCGPLSSNLLKARLRCEIDTSIL